MESEGAPEIVALDQPNSVSNGLKKTPKVYVAPFAAAIMKKVATTMI